MGALVQSGRSLVLCVARLGESRKGTEVERAIDDVASRGESVSQNVGRASVAVDISAVGLRDTGGRGAALRDNLVEDGLQARDGAGRRALEVFLDLRGVGRGSSVSSLSKRLAVCKGVYTGGLLAAGAIALHSRSLDEVAADLLGLSTIDVGGDSVAGECHCACDLGRVHSSGGQHTSGCNVKCTATAKVVQFSHIERGLHGLARCDDLEGVFGDVVCSYTNLDATEGNLGACDGIRYQTVVEELISLTALEDLYLLGSMFPKKGSSLPNLDGICSSVRDGSLDGRVTGQFKLHIKRRGTLADNGGIDQGDQSSE